MATISAFINPTPMRDEVRDMSINQLFTAQSNFPSVTAYRLEILNLDNTVAYNSGQLTLTPTRGMGAIISHTVPLNSVANNVVYKQRWTAYNGTDSATTLEFPFIARANPTITLDTSTTIPAVEHTFTDVYSQPNDGIAYYNYELINTNTNTTVTITENTGSSVVQFSFGSYVNGQSYQRILRGRTLNGNTFQATSVVYTANYNVGNLIFKPSVVSDTLTSTNTISWAGSSDIIGSVSGGSVSYNDNGVVIPSGATVSFDGIDAGEDFTIVHVVDSVNNLLIRDATNPTYTFGYDLSAQKFFLDNNGYRVQGDFFPINQIQFPIVIFSEQFQFSAMINGVLYEVVY